MITFRTIDKKTEDGRTLIEHDQYKKFWREHTPAQCRAEFLAHAAYSRRTAEKAIVEAEEYERAAADAADMLPREELVEDTRTEVLARLDWAAHWLVHPHMINDTWPPKRNEDLPRVRAMVVACTDFDALTRWSVICECMPKDWHAQLIADLPSEGPVL